MVVSLLHVQLAGTLGQLHCDMHPSWSGYTGMCLLHAAAVSREHWQLPQRGCWGLLPRIPQLLTEELYIPQMGLYWDEQILRGLS